MVGGLVGGLDRWRRARDRPVTFGVDQIVSGVAINILALVSTLSVGRLLLDRPGGGPTQSPQVGPVRLAQAARGRHVFSARSSATIGSSCRRRRLAARAGDVAKRLHDLAILLIPLTGSFCGARRSGCGCGPAARIRPPPNRWESRSTP